MDDLGDYSFTWTLGTLTWVNCSPELYITIPDTLTLKEASTPNPYSIQFDSATDFPTNCVFTDYEVIFRSSYTANTYAWITEVSGTL